MYNLHMQEKYYLIKQSIPFFDVKLNKVWLPCNISHLQKLISFMVGNIEVFLVDTYDNSRLNCTKDLGFSSFNIYEHDFEKIKEIKIICSNINLRSEHFVFYSLFDFLTNPNLSKIFMYNHIYKVKSIQVGSILHLLSCSISEHQKILRYGNTYEEFILNKYKNNGYQVILNGKKSFNDGGIDIIAKKCNSVVLVQCKNWSMSNKYKINQKDLRAFIGDCYLYLLKNPSQVKVSFHFIVSHDDILTKSADIFLKENTFLKFKCIPFELN